MSAAEIKVWHKHFKGARESVESDPHSGKPTTSKAPENAECVRAAINKDWRLTMQDLEADQWVPKSTVLDFDTGSWYEMCCGKISSVTSATRAKGTLCCSF